MQGGDQLPCMQVWKRGSKMRVDGSLMGLDDKNTGLLPQWKRGHFSLLFDGATTPATILLCDHVKKKYLDLNQEKKKHKPSIDEEVGFALLAWNCPGRSGCVFGQGR